MNKTIKIIDLYNRDVNGNTIELNNEVEIIEESEQDINIQAIEELDEEAFGKNELFVTTWSDREKHIIKQQNKILQAVKQLDNKIKEK